MTQVFGTHAIAPASTKKKDRPLSKNISNQIRTRSTQISLTMVLIASMSTSATAAEPLPKITLRAGIHQITAEVAATPTTRETGLMYRKSLPTNQGMLFIFEQKEQHCFWMRNTLIPLSIAFIADDGTIINIENMQPKTDQNHCAKAPVRYALEMQQGWFAQKGIKVGSQLGSIPQ